jgi:hypothetical protein
VTLPGRILCYVWIALLSVTLFIAARSSYSQSVGTEEFPYGCDSFGYLVMAKEIRHGFANGVWPEFKLESPQTRTLINFMQQQQLPLAQWDEVVAPHAHHYFPQSGYVGVQYPPGTGLALAMFDQGEAVYGLNRLVVISFALVGIAALILAVWKQAWASIGLVVLALSLGLIVLVRIGASSFSINVALVPILFTCVFALIALALKKAEREGAALFCALVAGLLLGFATLARLPALLLMPGFLVLLWPGFRSFRLRSLPVAFVIGIAIGGVVPVAINQHNVAGAWYLSTYASVDAAAPTLERLKFNLDYFLGEGPASVDNWSLLYALAGFAGCLLLYSRGDGARTNRLGLSWRRLALAVFLIWFIPICYFLTHRITAPHYMIPSIFGAIALLGLGALAIEASGIPTRFYLRTPLTWVALVLVVMVGALTLDRVWSTRPTGPTSTRAATRAPILLPAELVDDRAWIWADLLTGTLWYYANKPAFKIQFTDEETRAKIFRFVFERGERQYLLQDSEQMKKYIEEIEKLGGKLEMRGEVEGQPYYLVQWPDYGPATNLARQ